jgi:ribonuclease R
MRGDFMADYKEDILAYISRENYKPAAPDQLFSQLKGEDQQAFTQILEELEGTGAVIISKKGKVVTSQSMGLIFGKYSSSERGYGFLIPASPQDFGDLFIPARANLGAMHGDFVLARVINVEKGGQRADGEVVKITKRNTQTITGVLEKSKNHGFVIPDNKKYCNDIFIGKKEQNGARDQDKVAVKITKYPDGRRNAEGTIIQVFGSAKTRGANYQSILFDRNIRMEFPPEALDEARSIPQQVVQKDIVGRTDLREEIIFTIDGPDAKDFDDAVSVLKKDNGNFVLGVHIADVSHYVKAGSPLDREAFLRGTSIYFVDQVVPMLPVELSNGICSLNPKVDRLTFSVFMEFTPRGERVSYEIKKTIIRSCERLIYADVSAVLEGTASPEITQKYEYITPQFHMMAELASILRKARYDRGAIDFDLPEAKIIVDKKGDPVEIVKRERGISDKIIEDFMLAANETVAEYACLKEKPLVYRVHETPDPEKTESFLHLAKLLGVTIKMEKEGISPKFMQGIMEQIEEKPYKRTLSTMMLRSMQKAHYLENNLGHFGLAAEYYAHFTSPIRRYPDLAIHRILTDMIEGRVEGNQQKKYAIFSQEASKQSSDTELNAVYAERDIDDLYKAIYMKKHIGEEFVGVISSVTSFGIFVELENTIEGLVGIDELDDDYYVFDDSRMCLKGERTKKTYQLGDKLTIRVVAADPESRRIDFSLAES